MTKRRTKALLKTARTGTPIAGANRTGKMGNGTTTPNKALEKKALNRALDEALDKDAAWDLFRKIRDHEGGFRKLIYQFDVGEGYKALGHKSLRACFRKRLSSYYSESYLYRQLYAAQIEHNLGDELLPMGKMIVPERVLRPLNALKDDPKQQRKAWKRACKQSDKPIPTLKAIEEAVAEISGKSSPKAKAERTGTAKLSEKQQIEAVGKRIVANHDRRFVKALIVWLGKHLPPRHRTQPSKHKS
jgi:hypothetical protein